MTEQAKRNGASNEKYMLILSGLIGSGKSTFARALVTAYPDAWCRCNQDELGNRQAVEAAARKALTAGLNVIIDRTNIDAKQRRTWLELARAITDEGLGLKVVTVSLTFTISTDDAEARLRQRQDHETIKNIEQAMQILPHFLKSYQRATPQEGFHYTLSIPATSLNPHPTRQEIDFALFSKLELGNRGEGVLPPAPPRKQHSRGRGGSYARGSSRGSNALYTPHARPISNTNDTGDKIPPWRQPWTQPQPPPQPPAAQQ